MEFKFSTENDMNEASDTIKQFMTTLIAQEYLEYEKAINLQDKIEINKLTE